MSDHREASKLATAAIMDLIARAQAMQAAVLRGDTMEAVEHLRHEALAVAEAYLDRTLETARVLRSMIEDLPNADDLGEEGARRLYD